MNDANEAFYRRFTLPEELKNRGIQVSNESARLLSLVRLAERGEVRGLSPGRRDGPHLGAFALPKA